MALPNAPAEAASVADLLAGATDREPITDGAGKSGARLERVRIEGVPHVVKYVELAADWTMRSAGCLVPAPLQLWRRGLLAALPHCIDQPIVGVAPLDRGAALLMRDVAELLVPVTDDPIPLPTHRQFLDHMAVMHATFWDAGLECDVVPTTHRYLDLSPWMSEAEADCGFDDLVPRLVAQGWPLLAEVAPAAAAVVTPLAWDPGPLVLALEETPQTFVHGNWKLDNLGVNPDGRTVLLDWEIPGRSPALSDVAWYLAINCRRLPESKESTLEAYRAALDRHGVDTGPWWDRQLALCLLGAVVQFGWEKAFGGYDEELAWWEARAVEGARLLS
ncbi:MAG TPA: phosphotransferase [Sporichthya sp.]|nr:phosphotransferase [Sporichthya sp.]